MHFDTVKANFSAIEFAGRQLHKWLKSWDVQKNVNCEAKPPILKGSACLTPRGWVFPTF